MRKWNYIQVFNKWKIDYLEALGISPICGYGNAAIYLASKRVKDALERLAILQMFGSSYLGQPAGRATLSDLYK